tara:strand:+ start:567 stop:878 length:312 start_codon:yes stop_codon:yes gene_type:complete
MTRFFTTTGQQLGASFAGDHGRTFHLTQLELELLWSLDEQEELESDSSFFGTAGDLLDLMSGSDTCSEEQLQRRFKKDLDQTLHLQERLWCDQDGQLRKAFTK